MMVQRGIIVAIPTLNSAETLDRCIRSIKDNIPVKKLIVVDVGSTDDTIKIAKNHGASIVHEPGPLGKVTYLQATLSDDEWFVQISSDIEVYPDWWESVKMYMCDKNIALITVLPDIDIRPRTYAEYHKFCILKSGVSGCIWLLRRSVVIQCKDLLKNVHVHYDAVLENCIREKGMKIILVRKKLFHPFEMKLPPRFFKTGQSLRFQHGLSLWQFLRMLKLYGWTLKGWSDFAKYKSSIKWWLDIRLPICLLYWQLWTLGGYLAGSKRWKS